MSTEKRTRLRVLMAERDLDAARVAELVGSSVDTVYRWIGNGDPDIPDYRLELLELKLKDQDTSEQ